MVCLEDQYNEIRDYLRKQHNANRSEVHGRNHGNGYVYQYYDEDIYDNRYDRQKERRKALPDIIFLGKIMVFLVAVLMFSCYIYGGQDLKKGAGMAIDEINGHIVSLEQDNDTVRETMSHVRSVWNKVKDFSKEHIIHEQ